MTSIILKRFIINNRCLQMSFNYSTKCFNVFNNNSNHLKYCPTIGSKHIFNTIDNNKIVPILDNKLDINMSYILNAINPIFVPDLNQLKSGLNVAKELPALRSGDKLYLDYKHIKDPRAYTHLTIIRRRKMKKHQRKKWRKKMLAYIKRKRLKSNIRKEKTFRAELLAQIKEAEDFDPQKYVNNILETIDNMPQPETPLQKIERIKDLIRKNRKETNILKPKFDD